MCSIYVDGMTTLLTVIGTDYIYAVNFLRDGYCSFVGKNDDCVLLFHLFFAIVIFKLYIAYIVLSSSSTLHSESMYTYCSCSSLYLVCQQLSNSPNILFES